MQEKHTTRTTSQPQRQAQYRATAQAACLSRADLADECCSLGLYGVAPVSPAWELNQKAAKQQARRRGLACLVAPAEVLAAQEGWAPDGMWTAGKYGGPRSGPAALIRKGQFCGSSTSPDEHVRLLAFCFWLLVLHSDLCQVFLYHVYRQRLDSALSGVLTASSWLSGGLD